MLNVRLKISSSSKRGFTLIEVMVAMLITLVGLMGLLQSVNLATEHNMKNQLRDEAVQIGEDYLSDLRVRSFSKFSSVAGSKAWSPWDVPSRTRGAKKNFVLNRRYIEMGADDEMLELIVKVSWSYRNVSSHYEVRSVRKK